MNKEPLKDKLRVVNCYYTRAYKKGDKKLDDGETIIYAQLESLESAVAWLKEELDKGYTNDKIYDKPEIRFIFKKIDEAFPDLK